jgi:hypothetical protein
MSVSSPVIAYISTIQSLVGLAGSTFVTATIQCTAGWEIRIPLRGIQASNTSAGPYLNVLPAIANAATAPNFATLPMASISITNRASGDDSIILRVDTGYYCLQIGAGGPNTATVGIATVEVVTAIINQ